MAKKALQDKISMRLLRLEFKSKAIKHIVKKILILLHIKAVETYCVSRNKNTANKKSSVRKSKQNRLTLVSNCAICGKERTEILLKIKEQVD